MSRRVQFYDDGDLECRQNFELVPGPISKLGEAHIQCRPCDLHRDAVFAGSVIEMPDGSYRLYSSGRHPDDARLLRLAYAESQDGVNWTKPDLGQMHYGGEDTNWIWPEGLPDGVSITQPQVVRVAEDDWRMWTWWHGHDVGRMPYVACTSEDGIRWKVIDLDMPHIMHPADRELGQNSRVAGLTDADPEDKFAHARTMDFVAAKRLRSNDATYVYYDQAARRFEMFSVWLVPCDEASGRLTRHDNAPAVTRVIHRRDSEDGIVWSDPEIIITPDEHDPMHQEFYYLAAQPDGDWTIGMLGNYRCWEQTMDLELCFSRDTHHWVRPLRGGWVPRGGPDEIDHMHIYATNRLIDRGDHWLLLYRGGNTAHNFGFRKELPPGVQEDRQETMLAEAPKGRFAGLQATDRCVGSLTLKRFNQSVERISVDANVNGRLQAELRDHVGRPIPGYELNACQPITGDSNSHVLTWGDRLTSADYRYDVVSLRIEVEGGVLYSVEV